jgi:hypothetical protein
VNGAPLVGHSENVLVSSSLGSFIGLDPPVNEISSKNVSPKAMTLSARGENPLHTNTISPISRTDASIPVLFVSTFVESPSASGIPLSRPPDEIVVWVLEHRLWGDQERIRRSKFS